MSIFTSVIQTEHSRRVLIVHLDLSFFSKSTLLWFTCEMSPSRSSCLHINTWSLDGSAVLGEYGTIRRQNLTRGSGPLGDKP